MTKIIVGGCDPSLTSFGMVKGQLCLETGEFTPLAWDIVRTAKSKDKRKYVNIDDLDRASALMAGAHTFFSDIDLLMAELPSSGSQSANGAKSNTVSIAVIASVANANGTLPVIVVRALDVKEIATGDHNASKKKMIEWMREEFTELELPKTAGVAEHIADAFASIYAGVQTPEFKLIRLGMMK